MHLKNDNTQWAVITNGTEAVIFKPWVAPSAVGEAALTVWDELTGFTVVADVLPVSPPGVDVAVVVSSAGVVNLAWVVTSAVPVVMVGDGAVVVVEVVGVDEDVWRELALSSEVGVAGVVVMDSSGLPVVSTVRFESGVECGLELMGTVVQFSGVSWLLVCKSVGPRVVVSAEEKASRQHARVPKVATMVLLWDTKQAARHWKHHPVFYAQYLYQLNSGKLWLTLFRIRNSWHFSPLSLRTEPALGLLEDLRGPKVSAVGTLVGVKSRRISRGTVCYQGDRGQSWPPYPNQSGAFCLCVPKPLLALFK